MKKKENKLKTFISMVMYSLLWAIIATIILSYLFGFKAILVNGWSSEPYIHYQSLIITSKFKKQDLKVGDFITYSYTGKSYITHQIIAIKTDGTYFEKGQEYPVLIDSKNYTFKYGYALNKDGTIGSDESSNISTTCDIIVMQRTYTDGKLNIDATKEYLNYSKNYVGKVILTNYTLGKTVFIIKGNMFICFGLLTCLILTIVVKEYYDVEPTFYWLINKKKCDTIIKMEE